MYLRQGECYSTVCFEKKNDRFGGGDISWYWRESVCTKILNPIVHISDLVKRKVRALSALRTVDDLVRSVQIGQPTVQRYILSMRQRCLAVIRAKSGYIFLIVM